MRSTRIALRAGWLGLAPGFALMLGCAFEDGQPWGRLDLSVQARLELPPARLDAEGRLLTANDYAIEIARVAPRLDAVTLRQSAGGGPRTFDPSRPPPGYSLCHNGHCHHDDGRLVDYEDIEIELAGAAATGGSVAVAVRGGALALPLDGAALDVPLDACPNECHMERGALATLSVTQVAVEISGRAFDRRPDARLPAEGVPFTYTVPASVTYTAPLTGAVGKGEPVDVRVRATLALPPHLFDEVDWSTDLDDPDTLTGRLATAISEHATLTVAVSR